MLSIKLNEHISKEAYKAGDFIFFEGDIDYFFYIIETGEIEIFKKTKTGTRVDIAEVGPGESFGEMALLDKAPRSASAQAKTDCVLIQVSEQGYQQLLAELPVWAQGMLKSFALRLQHMNQLLIELPQFISSSNKK